MSKVIIIHSRMKASTALMLIFTAMCIIFINCSNTENIYKMLDCSSTKEVILTDIKALQKALSFVDDNYQKFNVDGLLGLVLTEANLWKLKLFTKSDVLLWDLIKALLVQVRRLRTKLDRFLSNQDEFSNPNKYMDILQPKNWIKTKHKPVYLQNITRYSDLKTQDKIQKSRMANYQITKNITIKSNQCLCAFFAPLKLIECPQLEDDYKSFCKTFLDGTSPPESLNGYPLSHYLLIRQIAARFGGYKLQSATQESYTKRLCYLMLKDAKTIISNKNQDKLQNQDLYLEDVVLCSMENYYDPDFIITAQEEILNWQKVNGCFSVSRGLKITKRSINIVGDVNDYCTDHTTGLGMAAIAAHLFLIQYNNSITLHCQM